MTDYSRRWAPMLMAAVVVTVIAAGLFDTLPLQIFEAVLLVTASIVYIPFTKGINRTVSLALIAGSVLLIVIYRPAPVDIMNSAAAGGPILVFLTLIEVLGSAIQAGGYDKIMTALAMRYARTPSSLRLISSFSALMLNLAGMFQASVPAVVYSMTGNSKSLRLPVAISASRGFGASIVANPFTPVTIMALHSSGAGIGAYLLYALPVAFFLMFINWLPRPGERHLNQSPAAVTREATGPLDENGRWQREHTFFLCLGIALFALLYVLFGKLDVGTVLQVILSLVGMSAVLGLSRPHIWRASLRGLPERCFRGSADILPLFAMGGMFGGLVVSLELLNPIINSFQQIGIAWLEAPFIALLLIFFRWIGVAPVISVFILGPVLAGAVTLPPPLYALALSFGANVAFLSSPFSGTSLFVAQTTGHSPFDIAVRRQGAYVLTTLLFVSCYIALWLIPA